MCNGFAKLSLLVVYLRLSPQRLYVYAVWSSIVIVALYTIILTLLMFFHCIPTQKAFDFKIQEGTCLDAAILYIATAVSNIITDVLLFVLPIPTIWGLRMHKQQKMAAIIMIGFGSM